MPKNAQVRIGVISDTHGVLRPQATAFLQGCFRIVHGGDIGGPVILDTLGLIAPVIAVRGNNDTGPWAQDLRETEILNVQGVRVFAIHNLAQIDIDPQAHGIRVVISGHSHKPSMEERGGVLYINPGSAGPRRFKLPIALGELVIEGTAVTARIIDLEDASSIASI
jgi:putative phosphoesterase